MKNAILFLLTALFLASNVLAQSDIKLRPQYGAESADLQSVLFFEDIKLERLSFTGSDLKGKDYQISVKRFVSGKLAQTDVIFDSKQDAYFKIKGEKLAIRVYAKVVPENKVKIEAQFPEFRVTREYKIAANQKEFALKNFLGSRPEQSIPLSTSTYILTLMMPYVKKDGSTTYCEVAQSGVNPEELGKIYPIPLYFLIDIKIQ